MFNYKIKLLPQRKDERYASDLTNMNLSNKVYKMFGKKSLKDYVKTLLKTFKKTRIVCLQYFLIRYNTIAGDYCEGVIPDPIPNSEVKSFSADGTLS